MATIEPAQLKRILATLPTADALALSRELETPSEQRRRRLDERDKLIQQALAGAEGASLTARAADLERRLNLVRGRRGTDDDLASQILALNGPKNLRWKHLARIARIGRNPDLRKNTDGIAQGVWSISPP